MASSNVATQSFRIPTPQEFAELVAARPYPTQLRKGDPDLGWFKAKPGEGVWGEWGIKAEPSRRGADEEGLQPPRDPTVLAFFGPDDEGPVQHEHDGKDANEGRHGEKSHGRLLS